MAAPPGILDSNCVRLGPCAAARRLPAFPGNASAFSNFIRDGHEPPCNRIHPSAKGDGVHPPSRSCPVERGASRGARHVRERLSGVILRHQRRVIPGFYLMVRQCSRMRANGTDSAVQTGRAVGFKAGAEVPRLPNPPTGPGPQPSGADRVQSSTGAGNVRWRREPGGGNTDPPEADPFRGSAATADCEQLNDERGVKPLPVSGHRDGAESGTTCAGRVRGSFCILPPEISPSWDWKP